MKFISTALILFGAQHSKQGVDAATSSPSPSHGPTIFCSSYIDCAEACHCYLEGYILLTDLDTVPIEGADCYIDLNPAQSGPPLRL
eukprot:scaffold33389_cov91-Cyclotella_meneghiniana.AAC.2